MSAYVLKALLICAALFLGLCIFVMRSKQTRPSDTRELDRIDGILRECMHCVWNVKLCYMDHLRAALGPPLPQKHYGEPALTRLAGWLEGADALPHLLSYNLRNVLTGHFGAVLRGEISLMSYRERPGHTLCDLYKSTREECIAAHAALLRLQQAMQELPALLAAFPEPLAATAALHDVCEYRKAVGRIAQLLPQLDLLWISAQTLIDTKARGLDLLEGHLPRA